MFLKLGDIQPAESEDIRIMWTASANLLL